MNNTDSLNLENARLMTILNAGRQKLDTLRHTIDYKSKLVDRFDNYPDEYIENVKSIIQKMDTVEIRSKAEVELQDVVNGLEMQEKERELEEELKQKAQLDAANNELSIQAELARRCAEKEQKCIDQLYKILEELDNALEGYE